MADKYDKALKALQVAENELRLVRNLLKHILAADVDSSRVNDMDAGEDCYLCWWAVDLAKTAADGDSIAGSLAENPPEAPAAKGAERP
jgi:hypothetical protein